tara:strand:+ start:20 stop:622 length:603 start_codon:yes stop_codon:yes gene_type:complete
MNVENVYWYFQSVINPETCNKIIQLDQRRFLPGEIRDKPLSLKKLRKTRNSLVKFSQQQWLFDLINPYMEEANRSAGWNFQIDWTESVQITRYTKNGFYNWHVDQDSKPYSLTSPHENYRGKTRKLSLSINLSDPTTYKGGRMQFECPKVAKKDVIRECVPLRAQGSIIVFPSFILHRVTPVTKGIRYSLVAWFLGKPFR